ncbi:putative tautomerase yrdN [Stenotrophomonas maltophilia RA8]|uniref:tautomerase family protein n=1 Tax=Stenotrophomonas maltophilia TaxID=40324 RepID=UPI0002C53C6A|nr:tautomerase family protein [Stenotrophomonas maltophilia]QGL74252.1 tautomerase family protein [Stenotrophomonas maltophilia]CCP14202.1 putative tautomerase yrdN [Stenotrophomonas maltophilia RA8]
MPYARISLHKGRSRDWLAAFSRSLQQSLEEAFDVPPHDCFQVFHQCDPGELVFDPDYAGGPRSEGFVLIHLTAGRVRSAARKQSFYARLVQRLAASPGIRPEDVMIVIGTTSEEDWSFSQGRVQLLEAVD